MADFIPTHPFKLSLQWSSEIIVSYKLVRTGLYLERLTIEYITKYDHILNNICLLLLFKVKFA